MYSYSRKLNLILGIALQNRREPLSPEQMALETRAAIGMLKQLGVRK